MDAVDVNDAVLAAKSAEPMEVPPDIVLVIVVIRPWRIYGSILGTVDDALSESKASSP